MLNLSRPFIQRPKATVLLVSGFMALGLIAYFKLPIESLPDVEFPTINVQTSLPGASAETMASSVAAPLERALSLISGVTSMSSSSSLGQTQIVVQFDLNRDIDAAAQDVQSAINAASGQLPPNLPNPPMYEKVDPNSYSIINLAVSSETLPMTVLYDYVDNVINPAISRLPGIGLVDYHGARVPAVRVQINPTTLAAHGLDLEDVRTALVRSTVDSPKGTVDGAGQTLLIASNDQLFKAAQYNRQIIAWRNGSPIRIGDVGQAVDSVQDRKSAAWSQGREAIIIDVHLQTGSRVNVTALVDRIKTELPDLIRSLPPAINVQIVGDHTQTTRASVNDVETTLGITVCLVAFVIFLFLRDPKATLIPSISIPLSLIGSFGFMYLLGFSLDNISLMGLTIAVGFVVDDAIVVMENITRHLEMGKTPVQAALDGAGEVGFTVISMTLSLIAVFIPLLLMGGVIGRVFREFSMTVGIALILSGIISLTQTAVSCSLFMTREERRPRGRFYRATEKGFDAMLDFYRRGLSWTLRHERWGVAVTVLLLLGSVVLFIIVPKGFIPEQDVGVIVANCEARTDIPFEQMYAKEKRLAEIAMRDPDVANVYAFVETSPATNVGRLSINLKPFARRKTTAAQILARLRPELSVEPGVKVFLKTSQDIQIGTTSNSARTQYQYVLQDSDLDELGRWSETLRAKLRALPQIQDVASDLNPSAPAVSVIVDRDKAASFGIASADVDQTLYDAFGQRQVAILYSQLDQRRVVLEVQPNWRLDARSLEAIEIKSPTSGQLIPLSAIARLQPSVSPMAINHLDSFPAVTLSFNLPPGVSLGEAVAAIDQVQRDLHKPPSLKTSFQGTAKAFKDSLSSQPILIISAIAVIYIILGVLYESFIHPVTILSSLPSATFGALAAMLIFHYDLSVITLIGLVLLVGIVKKNAIMMVDVALSLQRETGATPERAIFDACVLRFRPIMMTTMAALLGALPLAFGHGAGSELRRPLGVAIVGGLLVSQSVTLYSVPIIYLEMERLVAWSKRRRASGGASRPGPAAVPADPAAAPETAC